MAAVIMAVFTEVAMAAITAVTIHITGEAPIIGPAITADIAAMATILITAQGSTRRLRTIDRLLSRAAVATTTTIRTTASRSKEIGSEFISAGRNFGHRTMKEIITPLPLVSNLNDSGKRLFR